jgi:hypothetical protein
MCRLDGVAVRPAAGGGGSTVSDPEPLHDVRRRESRRQRRIDFISFR